MNFRLKTIDLMGRTEINKWYNFLQQSQFWSIEQQEAYQNKKLQHLVKHSYAQVPYYKELFIKLHLKPSDIGTKEDLQKLPVIKRSDLQQNYRSLMANNHQHFYSQHRSTGGTTGEPVRYLSDISSWSLHWALKYRSWEMSPYKIGDKIGIIGGASVIPEKVSIKRLIWNKLNNFLIMPSAHITNDILKGFIHIIKKNKIEHLRGYPSRIAILAEYCLKNNILLNLKSVITTAEVLQPIYKEIILKAFTSVIIDSYGCADGGGNANTCSHDIGFHISFESAIWEVCNTMGRTVSDGESGEVTLTSLSNYAMPLLRYQPGDVIKNNIITDKCKCGLTLPRIQKIVGKTSDIIRFNNGRSFGLGFASLFTAFPLVKWQLIQNDMQTLNINIIPNKYFTERDANKIIKTFQYRCGEDVDIIINKVNEIQMPPSGKQRIIINNTLK